MNALEIIDKYCTEERLRDILLTPSRAVADKALDIVRCHPELEADAAFVEEAALLHDIGIVHVDAPAIACFGTEPYIKHGVFINKPFSIKIVLNHVTKIDFYLWNKVKGTK